MTPSMVDDRVEPSAHLAAEVVEVREGSTIEEGALDLPEAALDAWLVVWVSAPDGHRPEAVVGREGEHARVVDGLVALPAQDHGLLAVVLALAQRPESVEGADVPVHERKEVRLPVDVDVFALEKTNT
ncbi:MAG: hypothetical protein IPM79_11275 [Polyangiaceae bacterium]|nr:hypothetical protein [Polyangiaceae bacterium]